jgi:hypothetical protein
MGNVISVAEKLPHDSLVLVTRIFLAIANDDVAALQAIRETAPESIRKHIDGCIETLGVKS